MRRSGSDKKRKVRRPTYAGTVFFRLHWFSWSTAGEKMIGTRFWDMVPVVNTQERLLSLELREQLRPGKHP